MCLTILEEASSQKCATASISVFPGEDSARMLVPSHAAEGERRDANLSQQPIMGDTASSSLPGGVAWERRGMRRPVMTTASTSTTAATTLAALAALVEEGFAEPGRGANTASTLRQLGTFAGDLPLTLADCALGYGQLAALPAVPGEHGSVGQRRKTCGEIATLAGSATGGDSSRLAAVFRALVTNLKHSEDSRHKNMVATATREITALEATGAQ